MQFARRTERPRPATLDAMQTLYESAGGGEAFARLVIDAPHGA